MPHRTVCAVRGILGAAALLAVLCPCVLLAQERADLIPPSIIHEPVRSGVEGKALSVEAVITDDVGVTEAILHCRSVGMGVYYQLPMRQSADTFSESIPAEFVVLAGVEYYIEAKDARNVTTYPAINPEDRPVHVEVVSSELSSFPEVTLLNPERGEVLESGDMVIAISFVDREEDVDVASIRLKIDGQDVTRNARLSRTLVTYLPKDPFAKGAHTLWITVRDDEGHMVGPVVETFTIAGAKPRRFGLEGDLTVGLKRDEPSIERANVPLWDNQVRVHANGQLKWLHWDGLLQLSSDETSFLTSESLQDRQPVNRYLLNLRSRWFDVLVGDSNPTYSDLSLKGVLVRGVHASFHWRSAQVTLTRGMTKRAIEDREKLVVTTQDLADSVHVDGADTTYYQSEHQQGTFRRMVTGAQLGFSREHGELALNLLGVSDDTTSICMPPDHLHRDLYKPKANVVATVSGALKLNGSKTVLSAEIGETVLTDNLYSELDPDEVGALPDFVVRNEDFFKVNASTKTTVKPELSDNLTPRLYRVSLRTPVPLMWVKSAHVLHLKTEYYRIPLGYVSLGNPQQQTDVRGLKVDTRSRFLRDQVDALFGFDTYRDNVDRGAKEHTTSNRTLVGNLGYAPDLPVLAPYDLRLSLGLRNQTRTNDAPDDTSEVDNTTNTLTLGVGAELEFLGLANHLNSDFMHMAYRDQNTVAPTPGFDSNALTVAWRSVAGDLSASLVGGFTSNKADSILTTVSLVDLKLTYDLLESRLNTYGGLSLILTSNDADAETGLRLDSRKLSFSAGAKYSWTRKQSLQAGLKFIDHGDRVDDERSYTEPVIEALYRYSL